MKKVLIKSLIAALVFETAGVVINLIYFAINEDFLLYIPRSGGEWKGSQAFGMMLNHYYPMNTPDWPGSHTQSTRLEFDPFSLVLTLVVAFSIFFLIFSIRFKAKKKKESRKAAGGN
jgi:hypothetical protein